MAHRFVIKQTEGGEFRAYFRYNSENIFWTETYKTRRAAREAIESIQKNGPAAPVEEA